MTGVPVVLGNGDRTPHEIYMQIAGSGQRLAATRLARARPCMPRCCTNVHSVMTQTTQTALANGRGKIEERLARWLLMAHDRVDGDEIPLTHEFLSIMLGVRRSGVTTAIQELERKGLVTHRRSFINIADREGLEESSNGAYTPPTSRS